MFKMSSWGTKSHKFEQNDISLDVIKNLLTTYTITEDNKELSQPTTT